MASGIARERVRTTTTVELPNMAAILQKRDMQPWFTVYFFDIGYPCYDQLTPVKPRYPLTILRAQVYSSSRSHVFVKLTADPVLVS